MEPTPDDLADLRIMYPSLSEDELRQADTNLREYVKVVLRIYERICEDPVEYEKLKKSIADIGQSDYRKKDKMLPRKSSRSRKGYAHRDKMDSSSFVTGGTKNTDAVSVFCLFSGFAKLASYAVVTGDPYRGIPRTFDALLKKLAAWIKDSPPDLHDAVHELLIHCRKLEKQRKGGELAA